MEIKIILKDIRAQILLLWLFMLALAVFKLKSSYTDNAVYSYLLGTVAIVMIIISLNNLFKKSSVDTKDNLKYKLHPSIEVVEMPKETLWERYHKWANIFFIIIIIGGIFIYDNYDKIIPKGQKSDFYFLNDGDRIVSTGNDRGIFDGETKYMVDVPVLNDYFNIKVYYIGDYLSSYNQDKIKDVFEGINLKFLNGLNEIYITDYTLQSDGKTYLGIYNTWNGYDRISIFDFDRGINDLKQTFCHELTHFRIAYMREECKRKLNNNKCNMDEDYEEIIANNNGDARLCYNSV